MPGGHESAALVIFQRAARWASNTLNRLGPNIDILRHPALIPDYRKSVKDVYRDFVRFAVRKAARVLDVLSHVQHVSDPNDNGWPSWVPKFFEPRSMSFITIGLYLSGIPFEGHYPYFARLHDCPLRGEPRDPDYLQLDGFRVDEIETVSDVIRFDLHDPLPVETIWNQIFDIPLFPRPNQRYVEGDEELDTAFFVTLNAGPLGLVGNMGYQWASSNLTNNRLEDFKVLTRQTKINILLWLQHHPAANIDSYIDLIRIIAESPDPNQLSGNPNAYTRSVFSLCQNRRAYRTKSGLIGIGPQIVKPGDQVAVLFGGSLPFILRRSRNEWVFIGDTYLHHENILMGREVIAVRSGHESSRIETFRLK
jgi:hypothetical protein